MEKMFLDKLEDAKKELEEFKSGARETEKTLTQEIKTGKEELAKAQAEREEHIAKAGSELNEVREARDTLIQQKNKIESFQDEQKNQIDRL